MFIKDIVTLCKYNKEVFILGSEWQTLFAFIPINVHSFYYKVRKVSSAQNNCQFEERFMYFFNLKPILVAMYFSIVIKLG